jgi:ribonuclease D
MLFAVNEPVSSEQLSYNYVTDTHDAGDILADLSHEEVVALDTETYWDTKAARSRVSLVQLATRGDALIVIDALAVDLDVVRGLVESSSVLMAAHNASFDETMLIGEGLSPVSFVDTLRLARSALRLPSYSLQAVAAHLLGVALDKSFQKSNWRRRPLTKDQLRYAATDAHVTLRIFDELRRRLEEQGRWTSALSSATLRRKDDAKKMPRRKRAPQPPAPPLTGEEKKIFSELKKWRLEQSNSQRVPAYMICPDRTLEHLARERPQTIQHLSGIYGLGDAKITRYGEELMVALRKLNF